MIKANLFVWALRAPFDFCKWRIGVLVYMQGGLVQVFGYSHLHIHQTSGKLCVIGKVLHDLVNNMLSSTKCQQSTY